MRVGWRRRRRTPSRANRLGRRVEGVADAASRLQPGVIKVIIKVIKVIIEGVADAAIRLQSGVIRNHSMNGPARLPIYQSINQLCGVYNGWMDEIGLSINPVEWMGGAWRAFGGDQNGTPFEVVESAGKVASSCGYMWLR